MPYSEVAYGRFVMGRRLRNGAMALGTVAVIGLLWLTAWANLGEAGVVLVFVSPFSAAATALVGEWRMRSNLVGVTLDASRRWVILTNLHPAFRVPRSPRSPARGRVGPANHLGAGILVTP